MPLPLTGSYSSKSRLVLTFLVLPLWYLLTWVVPDIFQKSSKTVVCVCVCTFKTLEPVCGIYGKLRRRFYTNTSVKFIFIHKLAPCTRWSQQTDSSGIIFGPPCIVAEHYIKVVYDCCVPAVLQVMVMSHCLRWTSSSATPCRHVPRARAFALCHHVTDVAWRRLSTDRLLIHPAKAVYLLIILALCSMKQLIDFQLVVVGNVV